MDFSPFEQSLAGNIQLTPEGASAYVPHPLPDEIHLPSRLVVILERAARAVAVLDGVGETLENPMLLIRPFMRREAALSSRIEGTQASVSDIYEFEAGGRATSADTREVADYVAALELGIVRLSELPICIHLAHEVHTRLMSGVRGQDRRPGEFRDHTVWIGTEGTPIEEARFVPPPFPLVPDLMAAWETWINQEQEIPPLIKAALLHYQFETIHPYPDGNGRLGRLFIVLYLITTGVLSTPLLYLSAYFEKRRGEYYGHLLRVSQTGDWIPWIEFFLLGAEEQAKDAVTRSRLLRDLQRVYRRRLQDSKVSGNTIRVMEMLFQSPIVTRPIVQEELNVSPRGASLIVSRLVADGMLRELPGTWPAMYVASEILDIVRE